MRPATTRLAAQVDLALAQAECAGIAAARDAFVAAVEGEVERLGRRLNAACSDQARYDDNSDAGELSSGFERATSLAQGAHAAVYEILLLLRALDIRMPEVT